MKILSPHFSPNSLWDSSLLTIYLKWTNADGSFKTSLAAGTRLTFVPSCSGGQAADLRLKHPELEKVRRYGDLWITER